MNRILKHFHNFHQKNNGWKSTPQAHLKVSSVFSNSKFTFSSQRAAKVIPRAKQALNRIKFNKLKWLSSHIDDENTCELLKLPKLPGWWNPTPAEIKLSKDRTPKTWKTRGVEKDDVELETNEWLQTTYDDTQFTRFLADVGIDKGPIWSKSWQATVGKGDFYR